MRPMASTSMSTTGQSTATSSACARSSRTSIRTSRRSKPSMASAIDTATADSKPAPDRPRDEAPTGPSSPAEWSPQGEPRRVVARAETTRTGRFRWRPVSPLTRRIIAVNVLPLALLAVGFLYLGKFEASLIGQQTESLHTQGEIFAAALSEGAVLDSADEGEILLPDLARQMMRRLVEPTRTRARLFDVNGKLIADSRLLRGPGDAVQVTELPPIARKGPVVRLIDWLYDEVVELLPRRRKHPPYRAGDQREDS